MVKGRNPRVISVTNQKGGVGKTTTTVNLAAALSRAGKLVAILDLDPQGNASTALGFGSDKRSGTAYDLLVKGASLDSVLFETGLEGLSIVPGSVDLTAADLDLSRKKERVNILREIIEKKRVKGINLDYILIDCPPALNLLTLNALVASDSVLVPLQAEFLPLEGLSQLMLSVREIRESANPKLRFEGIALTMFDGRNNLCTQVEADVRVNLKRLVFKTVIPRSVKLSEAPSFGLTIFDYSPRSKGAIAYRALAIEILERHSGL